MNKITIAVTLAASLAASNVFALRCDGKLVYESDSEYQVRQKCGEPDNVSGDVWEDKKVFTYEGNDGSITEVETLNGTVRNIETNRNL